MTKIKAEIHKTLRSAVKKPQRVRGKS